MVVFILFLLVWMHSIDLRDRSMTHWHLLAKIAQTEAKRRPPCVNHQASACRPRLSLVHASPGDCPDRPIARRRRRRRMSRMNQTSASILARDVALRRVIFGKPNHRPVRNKRPQAGLIVTGVATALRKIDDNGGLHRRPLRT